MRSTTGSRRVAAAVVGLAMLGVGAVGTPSASAAAGDRVCEPSGRTLVNGGRYIVQNNRLGTAGTQCVTAEDGGFTIDAASGDVPLGGPPKGYPSIFIGQHRGGASTFGIVPKPVDEVGEDRTTANTNSAPGGWSAGYHLWFSSTRTPSGDGDDTEIVIWTDRGPDQPTPVGVTSGALTVEDQDYTVWVGRGAGSDVITFVRDEPSLRGDVPIRPFLDESLRRGLTEPGSWLTSVQFGFEVWQGGQGLQARNFSYLERRNPDADPPTPPATLAEQRARGGYTDFLCRPVGFGAGYWVGQYDSRRATDVTWDIAHTNEFHLNELNSLYKRVLGRPAAGDRSAQYWLDRLNNRSLRVEDVDVALNATPEALGRGDVTKRQYANTVGRAPSAGEVGYWDARRAQVGAEQGYRDLYSTPEAGDVRVRRAYAAELRRAPGAGELAYWRGKDAENYVNVGVLISGTDEYTAGLRAGRLGTLDRAYFGRCGV